MKFPPTYGEQLRAARKDAGLTQADLAERLGVTPSRVSSWERSRWDLPRDKHGLALQYELGVLWLPQYLTYEQQRWLVSSVEYLFQWADKCATLEELREHLAFIYDDISYKFPDEVNDATDE